MERRRDEPAVAGGLTSSLGGGGVVVGHPERAGSPKAPFDPWPFTPLADRPSTSTCLLPQSGHIRKATQWFRRLVGLSPLGWTFVVAAVFWEIFAIEFSECAGWGWDKGAFFFFWGLGVLAVGFSLRSRRQRPAVSRLFLGMNILVLGVLSLVVATR